VTSLGHRPFSELLLARAYAAGVTIGPEQQRALGAYYQLLRQWNSRINLTALPLDPPTDAAVERLFIEPLVAAKILGRNDRNWIDIGSGGGSPAIPMKVSWLETSLTMVESKARKASFLREAIRSIPLVEASVAESRFESLTGRAGTADLVTVRAVRLDSRLIAGAYSLLQVGGRLAMFRSSDRASVDSFGPAFSGPAVHKLSGRSSLVVWCKRKK